MKSKTLFAIYALQWSKSFAICEQLQSVYRSADFFQLLRVSDFGFLSVFGLRPSGFRLRRAAFSAVKKFCWFASIGEIRVCSLPSLGCASDRLRSLRLLKGYFLTCGHAP